MALGLRRKLSKKKLSLGKKDDISSKELVTNCETEAHRPSSSTPHCCGMANLGNTCYINSVVQALKHCPHLLDELQKNTRKSKESRDNVLQEFIEVLQTLTDNEDEDKTTAYKPHLFVKLVQDTLGFESGIQHDSQELLCSLLSYLKYSLVKQSDLCECASPPCKVRKASSPTGATRKITHFFSKCESEVSLPVTSHEVIKPTNSISDLFEGVLKYDTKCMVCEEGHCRSEQFFTISLPVVDNNGDKCGPYSVSECLAQFCKTEYLSSENKYYCNKQCQRLTEARRSITFHCTPKVLIVHLNRFSTQSQSVNKVGGSVAVSLTMSVGQWCADAGSLYGLFAVVFHSGTSCHSGHYITVAKGNDHHGNQWLMYDDDSTSVVSYNLLMNYLSPINIYNNYTPYILFYKKIKF